MEDLLLELLSKAVAALDDLTLSALFQSSKKLGRSLRSVGSTSRFWRDRCSYLLREELWDMGVNWKQAYLDLRTSKSLLSNAEAGNVDTVLVLLDQLGADPAANNNTVILHAAAKGHLEIVKLLLGRPGVDPTAKNNYAIRFAAQRGGAP